jgi:iron-sulfur cluster insertion protein
MEFNFDISDEAAERIINIFQEEKKIGASLRIRVDVGGCAGFQYNFDIDEIGPQTGDLSIEKNGASILIDDISANLIKGSKLVLIEDLGGYHFEIKNPNAASGCGCGNSFSVKEEDL